jgi:hypothetical protein
VAEARAGQLYIEKELLSFLCVFSSLRAFVVNRSFLVSDKPGLSLRFSPDKPGLSLRFSPLVGRGWVWAIQKRRLSSCLPES